MSTICISKDASLSQSHEVLGAIKAKVVGGMDYSQEVGGMVWVLLIN